MPFRTHPQISDGPIGVSTAQLSWREESFGNLFFNFPRKGVEKESLSLQRQSLYLIRVKIVQATNVSKTTLIKQNNRDDTRKAFPGQGSYG